MPTVFIVRSVFWNVAVTGRSLTGQIQSTSISLTYAGVKSGPKESLYGPTRQFAGQWLGTVSDPGIGIGFGELFVSSHNECLVFYLQGFQNNIGVGTVNAASLRQFLFIGRHRHRNVAQPTASLAERSTTQLVGKIVIR